MKAWSWWTWGRAGLLDTVKLWRGIKSVLTLVFAAHAFIVGLACSVDKKL